MKCTPIASRLRQAFTLIETLVVVSIIVLILVLTAPSLSSAMQAAKLTAAGDNVLGFLAEAQQIAMAQNTPVEVRFFKYQTPLSPYSAYRSMQLFRITTPPQPDGSIVEQYQPVGSLIRISEGILLVDADQDLSALLSGDGFDDKRNDSDIGYSGQTGATYNAIRFMTDGSARKVAAVQASASTLSYPVLQESCLTLCADIGSQVNLSNLPRNFYTIQIDPYTGKIRTYRPGQR